MGLDIYLYKFSNYEDTRRREKEYDNFVEEMWEKEGEYDDITEDRKEELRQEEKLKSKELRLNSWGGDEINKEEINIDHPKYEDHYFKIGYFRSSYNEGGINSILRNIGLPTLAEIFNYEDDTEYYFQPDWEKALENAENVLKGLIKADGVRIHRVSVEKIFGENKIKSPVDAYNAFVGETDRNNQPDFNYSNGVGDFYMNNPVEVLAMIPGTEKLFGENKCLYYVTKTEDKWYEQALEIVIDTIKYVLEKEDKEKYYLSWSG